MVNSVEQKKEKGQVYGAELHAFFQRVGLGLKYHQVSEKNARLKARYAEVSKQSNTYFSWEGALNVRVLGNSLQSTYLNLLGGVRYLQFITKCR